MLLSIEATDELSEGYTLYNWESGILSGIFYASRKCKRKPHNWLVTSLEGRLGSNSMDALAHAAGRLVFQEALSELHEETLPGWTVQPSESF